MVVLWLVASAILTPIVVLVLAPGMPPGNSSAEAAGQVVDNTLLFGIAGIQLWWIVTTVGIVLFLAAYGTVRMLEGGAGGGQGPSPIAIPASATTDPPLQVQVVAQQWQFNYRFPSYGGVETSNIELPAHSLVEFHVTSLDVIHSWWAYQLGVKADANPGVDNVAYVHTREPMIFNIHCAELCGVWHGYMFGEGHVVTTRQFAAWIALQRRRFAISHKTLGPYSKTYFPVPLRRGG
jgi:cytochrome c oxidase subunit 2